MGAVIGALASIAGQVVAQAMADFSADIPGVILGLIKNTYYQGATTTLTLDSIKPATDKNLNIHLTSDGKFIINQILSTSTSEGQATTTTPAIVFDSYGNASFAGEITARNFKIASSTEILAINNQLVNANNAIAGLSVMSTSSASTTAYILNALTTLSSTTDSLASSSASLSQSTPILCSPLEPYVARFLAFPFASLTLKIKSSL